jgi:nucleotide-binding universal stress UspA family protein
MTTVIGLVPGERGAAAVHLGAMMARSAHDRLVVASVVPTPWPPNPYRDDAEYQAAQEKAAEEALSRARTQVGPDLSVDFVLHRARSVSSGILEVAQEHQASLVALGSSATGPLGLVTLGGVAQRILHTADIPVTLAPMGFDTGSANARVSRITVAFGRADGDSDLLVSGATTAKDLGVPVRVACFAVRPMAAFTGGMDERAEDLMVAEWVTHLDGDIAKALRTVDSATGTGSVATRVETVVGQGSSWGEALSDVPWSSGDVLAIGASSSPVSRFFLGSHASKIVRSAPVPVLVVPRSLPMP